VLPRWPNDAGREELQRIPVLRVDRDGAPAVEAKRMAYNQFIRTAGIFDGVIDFGAATIDKTTGELKAEFQPNATTGGPGDKLHPNRAGYAAMGRAIDLGMIYGE
jgi:lysophospholipase L1-like esterase